MTSEEILALPMKKNDADAKTVRDYLKAIVAAVWSEGEGFSGKRPFGNSGWEYELLDTLAISGAIPAKITKTDFGEDVEMTASAVNEGRRLIALAISAM